MKSQRHFILYSCCIPVYGVKRAIIVDFQRKKHYYIPEKLIKCLISDMYIKFNDETKGWIKFLEKNELGFWTKEPSNFPRINLEWKSPRVISNALIDISKQSVFLKKDIFIQLDELGCESLQLRFVDQVKIKRLESILQYINQSRLRSIELIFPFNSEITENIESLIEEYKRISFIGVYDSPENELRKYYDINVFFTKQLIQDMKSSCGQVSKNYFSYNIKTLTESLEYNSCLNQKVSIDEFGRIKNCPSMDYLYGNINNKQLKSIVQKSEFKRLWKIKKDDISVCKDCEYRHICTDCRAHVDDPDDQFSHPSKCKYNPYLGKWEGEAGYIPVQGMSLSEVNKIRSK